MNRRLFFRALVGVSAPAAAAATPAAKSEPVNRRLYRDHTRRALHVETRMRVGKHEYGLGFELTDQQLAENPARLTKMMDELIRARREFERRVAAGMVDW